MNLADSTNDNDCTSPLENIALACLALVGGILAWAWVRDLLKEYL